MAVLTKRFLAFEFPEWETGSFGSCFEGAFDTLEEAVQKVSGLAGLTEVVDLSAHRTVWQDGKYLHACPQCSGTGKYHPDPTMVKIVPPRFCPRCNSNGIVKSIGPSL